MGPIEREIRGMTGLPESFWMDVVHHRFSIAAYAALRSAADSLGTGGVYGAYRRGELPEAISEAIEAAEALGL